MSRKIHHGANGSYKTSGALNDDLMTAVESGRTIISNVRGLESKEAIIDAYFSLKPLTTRLYYLLFPFKTPVIDFDLIYIDTEHPQNGEVNMEKLRSFFVWSPPKSFFIFDEVDEIYPPKIFTQTHINKYDYPATTGKSSYECAVEAGRHQTLNLAFSKHRHMNWDFIFTCTSIKNVHPMILQGSDMCYRHFNLANIGSFGKGKYREIAHSPDNNGSAEQHAISNVIKKIPKELFKIYKSTSTGETQDVISGTDIFKGNFKLKFMIVFVLILFAKTIYDFPKYKKILGGGTNDQSTETIIKTDNIGKGDSSIIKTFSVGVYDHLADTETFEEQKGNKNLHIPIGMDFHQTTSFIPSYLKSFFPERLVLTGRYNDENTFFYDEKHKLTYSLPTLRQMGLELIWITNYSGFIKFHDVLIPFNPRPQDINDFCCLPNGGSVNENIPNININTPFSKKQNSEK